MAFTPRGPLSLALTEDFLLASNLSSLDKWASEELLDIRSKISQILKGDASNQAEVTMAAISAEKPPLQKRIEAAVQQAYKDMHSQLMKEAIEIFENIFAAENQWAQFAEQYKDTTRFEVLYALHHDVLEKRKREKMQVMIIVVIQAHESMFLEAVHFEFNSQGAAAVDPLNKARLDLAARLKTSFETTANVLDHYKREHGVEFEVKGIVYRSSLEAQRKFFGLDWANFSRLVVDPLVFYSPTTGSIDLSIGSAVRECPTKFGFLTLMSVATPPLKELDTWRTVFCVFSDGVLNYFEIDPFLLPQGTIPLRDTTVEEVKSSVPAAMYPARECFKCQTPERTFYVHADSESLRNEWVSLINDHMKTAKPLPDTASFDLATQVDSAVHVGFLTKSGGRLNLSWKRRLVVLNQDHLSYYMPPDGLKARGHFRIQACMPLSPGAVRRTVTDSDPTVAIKNALLVHTNCGPLLAGTNSAETRAVWAAVLGNREMEETPR